MKYYMSSMETYNDGTTDFNKVYSYTDIDTAIGAFHRTMGTEMYKDKCQTILCIVTDSEGTIYKNEHWERPATTTTTTTEE